MWYSLDTLAHWLNRWHLMPRRLGRWICDRFDLSLGVTREELTSGAKAGDFDFYEDDEPAESIVAAFESSRQRGTTAARNNVYRTYTCPHMTISGPLKDAPTTTVCGCVMQQV